MGLGFHLEKTSKVQKTNNHHGEQRIPSLQKFGCSVEKRYGRSHQKLEKACNGRTARTLLPWNQVMPGVINKNRLWFWTCILAVLSLFVLPDIIFGINPLYNGGTPYHVFPKGNDLSKED